MARRRMPVCVTYSDASGSRDDGERRGGKPTFYRPDTMAEAEPSFDALGPYVDGDEYEEVAAESTTCEHVHWDDFRLSPARSWDEVRWVAFRTRLSREELVGRFGPKIGGAVPLDETTAPEGELHAGDSDAPRRAEVWEIWDKPRREVVFLATGAKAALLDAVEDPLGLADFFPVPRPLYSVPATDSLTPYPEFLVYEDQARELDEVTRRIMALTKALKLRGIYDSAQPEIARLLTADDNQMIPSEHFMSMIERGGLDKAVQFAPVETIAAVLSQLYANREQIKQAIYELTGLADILRGSTRPSETATAQSIKARWGSLRLQDRQREVQRLIRDLFRLQAEVVAEKFGADTLAEMTGLPVDETLTEFLRAGPARGFPHNGPQLTQ